jgi:protein-S-isoprenylcysteine O-methyltransferase Ste14
MDTIRQVVAILLVVGLPPAVSYWFLVHPLVGLWRRIGPRWAYGVIVTAWALQAGFLFVMRGALLGRDRGARGPLIAVGLVLYLASIALTVLCKRQLRASVLSGVPEVSAAAGPGRLLQEGVFAVIRHPRYASVILGTTGLAMVVNYSGVYAVVGISLVALWPVIVLEERELGHRFGTAYEEYRRRTPALLPRRFPRTAPKP